jgi:DNA modification methylase
MNRNAILIGDVRAMLRTLPERSVHCVVTSPPYWGLRAYGTAPQVWGGDDGCEHDWGCLHRSAKANDIPGPNGCVKNEAFHADKSALKIAGQSCQKCSAWRGELGSEPTPELYVTHLVDVFAEVHRVLRDDGTLWLNIGDTYSGGTRDSKSFRRDRAEVNQVPARNGSMGKQSGIANYPAATPNRSGCGIPPKNLVGIPWRVAFALQSWGWYLRSECIWHKPNAMPHSVKDRPSTNHEQVFLLTKRPRYFYDHVAVQEPVTGGAHQRGNGVHRKSSPAGRGIRSNDSFSAAVRGLVETRNLRTVWRIPSQPYKGAHFATFPPRLVEPCIKAGTSERGCCPACGTPWRRLTTRERVATRPGRDSKVYAAADSGEARDLRHNSHNAAVVGNRDPLRHITRIVTTGWQQSCQCEPAEPVPAIVLDLFFGSGTVGVTAEYLGRNWIGIELNPEYPDQARERIAAGYRPTKSKRDGEQKDLPLRGQLTLSLE